MNKKLGFLLLFLSLCLLSIGADSTALPIKDANTAEEFSDVKDTKGKKSNVAGDPLPSKEFRPEIGTGLGYYQFLGDVRTTDSRSHFASSLVYSFYATRRMTDWLDFGVRYSTGVMVGAETGPERYLNFKSVMHEGAAYFAYDFSNFFDDSKILKPYVSVGFSFFEFNNKGDMFDANGNAYHYWEDGSIRTAAENSAEAANAVQIERDYVYETDLRKADLDGFGRYSQVGFGIPLSLELEFNITDRFSFRIGTIYTYAFTDLLDNVTENSAGSRAGEKGGDHYLQNKISLHYDFFKKLRQVEPKNFEFVDYLAFDVEDDDKDEVINEFDLCPYTLKNVEVDEKGCPMDIDEDGIADFLDKDNGTPAGLNVDEHGIALDDDDYLYWYMKFIDSLEVPVEVLERIANKKQRPAVYRVFLKEFKEEALITDDSIALFSSEPDLKVFTDKDKKTVYTAGTYATIGAAEERKNQFVKNGIKDAQVVVFDDNEVMKAQDWDELADRQMKDRFKADFEKVKALDGMYAVKLGSTSKNASSFDKAKYLKDSEVIMIDGERGTYDYVLGPFIDTVTAGQNARDYQDKGFLDAEMVKVSNGKIVPPVKPSAEDSNPLSDEELRDYTKLKDLDGMLLVKVGTINSQTSYEEKQKLLNEPGLISIVNSDRSVDFVYKTGYQTKASARTKKLGFVDRGFPNAQVVQVSVQKRELKPVMEELMDSMYTVSLGSYRKGMPNQEISKVLSIPDAKQVKSYNPNANNYIAGIFKTKEEAKDRMLELAFQGFNTRIAKYENEKMTPVESTSLFNAEEQKIIKASKTSKNILTNEAVFRVQVGAFKNQIPESKFKDLEVLSFLTPKGISKYMTEGGASYRDAYIEKLRLKKLGFGDAFVVAHKDGKSIPLKDLVNDEEIKSVKEEFGTGDVYDGSEMVYKVQVGAFKDFSAEHSKLRGYENVEMEIYGDYKRILTGEFYSYPEAKAYKERLINEAGYSGAFVVAYAKGQRLSPTGVDPNVVELGEGGADIIPEKIPGLVIRVQIGLYRGAPPADIELLMAQLDEKLTKEVTPQGIIRYTAGEFYDPMAATAYKQVLREKGFKGAFLVAYYNSERIDIKEALELAKKK